MNIAKFLRTNVLKNIFERLYVVSSSNAEQHLLAKLNEMGSDIIKFHIYSFHFGVVIFAFYP